MTSHRWNLYIISPPLHLAYVLQDMEFWNPSTLTYDYYAFCHN